MRLLWLRFTSPNRSTRTSGFNRIGPSHQIRADQLSQRAGVSALPYPAEVSDDLVPVFIPALAVLLLNQERAKGSPLTQSEVEEIRDRSVVTQMARERAEAMAEERGYEDLDPERAWETWRAARHQLLNGKELELPTLPEDLLERLIGLMGASTEAIELALSDLVGLDRGQSDFWSWFDYGVSLSTERERVVAVFLYGERREGFEPYQGPLPLGLSYDLGEAEALERCGEPMVSSGSAGLCWHKFEVEFGYLHLQFAPGGERIALVTLMPDPV